MYTRKRRTAVATAIGLLGASLAIITPGGIANAGTETTNNACFSNATATFSDLAWTLAGTGSPNPATLGAGNITLASSTVAVNIPATLLVAGYNLGLLTVGANSIPTTVFVARQATNVTAGPGQTQSGANAVQVDSFTVTATTTITDPDGTPGTGDESATPLAVNEALPNMVVTPTGGSVEFSQAPPGSLPTIPAGIAGAGAVSPGGSVFATASVAGGLIRANFDCFPGTTIISPPGGTSGTAYTPAAAAPFETVAVTAPPTAPVCNNVEVSAPAGQSVPINLAANCTDVNGNINLASFAVSPLTPASPEGGTLTGSDGVYTYTAPAVDPGVPVTFTFTVADSGGLVSNTATTTITVLANRCDATAAPCSLTEIVVQPVIGTTMTFDKAPGNVIMSPVILNGESQVSSGAIQAVQISNARGTAAGWNVTGYITDLGNSLSPRFSPLPGVSIAACSAAGSFGLVPDSDRNCIPGDNMAWNPRAAIAHNVIPGDVAEVTAGTATSPSATAWLTTLRESGLTPVNGIGGLQEQNLLCSAPVDQSGGTFICNADLYLGVPASAGAGASADGTDPYVGGLVLTLA